MIPKRPFTESLWQHTPFEVRQAFEALELEVGRQSKALSEADKMIGILLDRVADIIAKNNQLTKRGRGTGSPAEQEFRQFEQAAILKFAVQQAGRSAHRQEARRKTGPQ